MEEIDGKIMDRYSLENMEHFKNELRKNEFNLIKRAVIQEDIRKLTQNNNESSNDSIKMNLVKQTNREEALNQIISYLIQSDRNKNRGIILNKSDNDNINNNELFNFYVGLSMMNDIHRISWFIPTNWTERRIQMTFDSAAIPACLMGQFLGQNENQFFNAKQVS